MYTNQTIGEPEQFSIKGNMSISWAHRGKAISKSTDPSTNRINVKFGVDWNTKLNRYSFSFHQPLSIDRQYWTAEHDVSQELHGWDQLKVGQIGPLDKPRRTSIPWCMSGWRKLSESWGTAKVTREKFSTCHEGNLRRKDDQRGQSKGFSANCNAGVK